MFPIFVFPGAPEYPHNLKESAETFLSSFPAGSINSSGSSQVVISLKNSIARAGAQNNGPPSSYKTFNDISGCGSGNGVVVEQILGCISQPMAPSGVHGVNVILHEGSRHNDEADDFSEGGDEYDDNEDQHELHQDAQHADSVIAPNQLRRQLIAIPNGWIRKVVSPTILVENGGHTGGTAGGGMNQQQKVFYYNPAGKRFTNQKEIDQYFAKLGFSVRTSLFNFAPPPQKVAKRAIALHTSTVAASKLSSSSTSSQDFHLKLDSKLLTKRMITLQKVNSSSITHTKGKRNDNLGQQEENEMSSSETKMGRTLQRKHSANIKVAPAKRVRTTRARDRPKGLSSSERARSQQSTTAIHHAAKCSSKPHLPTTAKRKARKDMFVAIKNEPVATTSIIMEEEEDDANGNQQQSLDHFSS